MAIALLILGLLLLTAGAEVLVRGAAALASRFGLPPLIIGLTVVAFGTSLPEVSVSIKAAYFGQGDIALGNIVGSNTFNVLFILGISAMIVPLSASTQLVRLDVPVMIAVSLLAWFMLRDGSIRLVEGLVLVLGMVTYTTFLIRLGKRQQLEVSASPRTPASLDAEIQNTASLGRSVLYVILGLGLLVLGGKWMVDGAVTLASMMGASDLLIGLTIVAAGTSMPEVATSIVASIRGQRDIAVGNVVGSNIFNILGVLGVSAIVAPEGVTVPADVLQFDLPIMIAAGVGCLPILITGGRISRGEGAILLLYYMAYLAFLVLAAGGHPTLTTLTNTIVYFVIPLTSVGLIASLWTWRRRKSTGS